MASINERDAGQDFEGNGPSSFDPRDYRVMPAAPSPRCPKMDAAYAAAEAQIMRAFGHAAMYRKAVAA